MTGTVVGGNSSVRGTPRNGMKGTAVEGEHRALGCGDSCGRGTPRDGMMHNSGRGTPRDGMTSTAVGGNAELPL